MKAIVASVLVATLVISGCSSTPDVIYLQPQCSVPTLSALPQVDAGELWDAIGDDTYQQLVLREKLIMDWALDMRAIVQEVCQNGRAGSQ